MPSIYTRNKETGEWEKVNSGFNYTPAETDPTVPAWAKEANKPSYTKSEVGLGNVDNVKQYSADNPPPYPVTSVNGQTGDVVIEAGGTIDEDTMADLEFITLADIDEICNPAPVILPNTFQKVRTFQSGKEYILLFGYNGAFYCLSNEAFNDWTVKAQPVSEVTSTAAQITFTTVPTLFTATASGDGFTLHNGSNNIYGEVSSYGTALRVNTNAGTVFTIDTSEMGGFDSDEIVAKIDTNAVWLRAALNNQSCCLKFESANTSIGIDYKDRDATYSTGFMSFILYEKIS